MTAAVMAAVPTRRCGHEHATALCGPDSADGRKSTADRDRGLGSERHGAGAAASASGSIEFTLMPAESSAPGDDAR